MRELIVYPIFGLLLLGIGMQLVDIAESTGAKAVDFADDMNRAIDCAVMGIELEKCSPNLMSHDFKEEVNRTIETGNEILEIFQAHQSGDIKKITKKGNAIIIEIEQPNN